MPPIPPDQQPNAPPPRGPHDHETRPHGTQQQPAAQRDNPPAETTNPPHQRQGDRASDDDDRRRPSRQRGPSSPRAATGSLNPASRSSSATTDLVAAGFVGSWTQLLRMIDDEGFPAGTMLSANVRAWRLDELEAWLASRPSARKAVPPDAVHPRVRDKRRAAAEAQP